jgi:hypothetical protein
MKSKLINEVGEKTYAIIFDKGDEIEYHIFSRRIGKIQNA